MTTAVDWKPFDTYPWGREVLYFVPSYETFSELLGRTVRHPERQIVMTLLMRQTFDGPTPTHWAELPASPSSKGQTRAYGGVTPSRVTTA